MKTCINVICWHCTAVGSGPLIPLDKQCSESADDMTTSVMSLIQPLYKRDIDSSVSLVPGSSVWFSLWIRERYASPLCRKPSTISLLPIFQNPSPASSSVTCHTWKLSTKHTFLSCSLQRRARRPSLVLIHYIQKTVQTRQWQIGRKNVKYTYSDKIYSVSHYGLRSMGLDVAALVQRILGSMPRPFKYRVMAK